jgi:hypothetical protein
MPKKMSELLAECLPYMQSPVTPAGRDIAIKKLGEALHATGPVLYRGSIWRANPLGGGHWRITQDDIDPQAAQESGPQWRSILPKKFRAKRRAGHPPAHKVNVPAPPSSDGAKIERPRGQG